MITEKRYMMLVWVVIALAALNISTMATIFWQQRLMAKGNLIRQGDVQLRPPRGMGPMFTEAVGFDNKQMADFKKLHQQFRSNGNATMEKLSEYRELTLAELKNDAPDTLKLNILAEKIGLAHAELKRQGYRFFLETKKLCRPDQYDELHRVFGQFMQVDGHSTRGNGMGEQGQRRQRKGRVD